MFDFVFVKSMPGDVLVVAIELESLLIEILSEDDYLP
jgi:hypothetical protein